MKEFIKENKLTLLRLILSIGLIAAAAALEDYNRQASLLLYILSYALSACLIITYAIINLIKDKKISEKLLMFIASVGAIIVGSLFEATVIVILFELGELVEDIAVTASRRQIKALSSLLPKKARLQGEKELRDVSVIKAGDVIEVMAGERIPVDGVVVSHGGEALTYDLKEKRQLKQGQEALAGYMCQTDGLCIKASGTFKQTAARRHINMSRLAVARKTACEKFIRRFSNIYTPSVILLAVALAIIPPVFDSFNFATWVYRACSFIALSCPSALVISAPIAYFCAMGYAFKNGVIVKTSVDLEALEDVDTMAFDKQGTLTNPVLRVIRAEAVPPYSKVDLLRLACIAELKSNHPIAAAIVRECKKLRFTITEGENYCEFHGMGIECDSEYGHIKSGNRLWVEPDGGANSGTTYVSVDGNYVGYIEVGDELKANSRLAFARLRRLGVNKRIIFSSEKQYKVDAVARSLLAEGAYSNLLPENRLDAIEDIIATTPNCRFAYCGDGTDDLQSLERADVGIAMAAAHSDDAVSKSNVITVDHDLAKIPFAIHVSRRTKRLIKANIIFALSVKAVLLVLSAIGVIPLLVAVSCDVFVLIASVLNSLRAGR